MKHGGVAWRERLLILGSDGLVYSPWEEGKECRGEMPSLLWHSPRANSGADVVSLAYSAASSGPQALLSAERDRALGARSVFERLALLKFWSARQAALDAFQVDPLLVDRLQLPDPDTRLLLLDLLPSSLRVRFLESSRWESRSELEDEVANLRAFLLLPVAEARLEADAPLERLAFALGRSYQSVRADLDQLLVQAPALAGQPMFTALNRLLAETDPLWPLVHARP